MMNTSPTLIIALITLIGTLAGTVAANQLKPDEYQTGTDCNSYAVKHLILATQESEADRQDWHIQTAHAYREMAEMGFREC